MKNIKGRVVLAILATVFFLNACRPPDEDSYKWVAFQGPVFLFNVSMNPSSMGYYADSGRWRHIPFRPHDVYSSMGDNMQFLVEYRNDMPDSFRIRPADSLIYLNGSLWEISLHDGSDMIPFFRQMSEKDRKSLQSISIYGEIPPQYFPWLDSIAASNRNINFRFESDSPNISTESLIWLADRFDPTFMYIELSSAELGILGHFKKLEKLHVSTWYDGGTTQVQILPAMPSLRSLTIAGSYDSLFQTAGFLSLNSQLKDLTIPGGFIPLDIISRQVNGLQRLGVYGDDSLVSFPYGKYFPQLGTLFLNQPLSDRFDTREFKEGQPLKELGIKASVSQSLFDKIIQDQPALRWLEIYGDDTLLVRNYESLRNLEQLRYLVITEKIGETTPIESMKKLRFLSVPAETRDDSLKLAALEKALPDTRVTPNGGFCMGTGWILLMWPLTALCLFVWIRIRRLNTVS
jgi:hypothetical protein